MNIHFEKANLSHKETIFNWLKEPHVQEFWDNSQEHKDDFKFHQRSYKAFKLRRWPIHILDRVCL